MCRQITQLAKCGHEDGTATVQCDKPTSECGGIFIKPELENVERLCAACQMVKDQQEEPRGQLQETAKQDDNDEGYCE